MSYKFLLFDLDDTLFDFDAAEDTALSVMFEQIGITLTADLKAHYSRFNQHLWEMYEQSKITRAELLRVRFKQFFEQMALDDRGRDVDKLYRESLAQQHQLLPQSKKLLESLSKRYRIFAVTNGIAKTQIKRLREAKIAHYFDGVFISEWIGHQKPQRAFFDYTFAHIKNFDQSRALLIGDSLSADILGGQNARIDTVWFNPHRQNNQTAIRPTYQINTLMDLDQLLITQD